MVRAYNEGSIHAGQEVPTKSSHVINLFYTRTIKAPIYSPLIIIGGCKLTLNFYTAVAVNRRVRSLSHGRQFVSAAVRDAEN